MTLSDRDRKLLKGFAVVIPVIVLVGFWFLILGPKREDAANAEKELTKQQQSLDQAQSEVASYRSAQKSFATDYATMVRLGKAVPTRVDMPSLIVQLDRASAGTGIDFKKIALAQESGGQSAQSGSGAQGSQGGSGGQGGQGVARAHRAARVGPSPRRRRAQAAVPPPPPRVARRPRPDPAGRPRPQATPSTAPTRRPPRRPARRAAAYRSVAAAPAVEPPVAMPRPPARRASRA